LDYVPDAEESYQYCVSVCLQWRWQTSLQFVRFRKRINIQRPAPPHYERAKVLKVCQPYYLDPRKGLSLADLCEKPIEVLPPEEDVVGFILCVNYKFAHHSQFLPQSYVTQVLQLLENLLTCKVLTEHSNETKCKRL
jgi:hypothetical protein